MKYHNEKMQAWCALDEATKDAIYMSAGKIERLDGERWFEHSICGIEGHGIYRAPIIEKQPLGPEDIRQGDAIRHEGQYDWDWDLVVPQDIGVIVARSCELISYETLKKEYLIRSIGEKEWRRCEK